MIFRKLNFRQLIRASAVNHRWNELIFYLLKDRVQLRVPPGTIRNRNTQEWTQNRTYKTALIFNASLSRDFNASVLEPIAEGVRVLKLHCLEANDGALLELLRLFKALETLLVKARNLQLIKAQSTFLRLCRGLLPNVCHLTIGCRHVRMMGLLKEVAPRLVTLDLELLPRLLIHFYSCRFDCLESLTLRINTNRATESTGFLGCLQQMKNLRKLGLFVNGNISGFRAAFTLTSVEELTLGGMFSGDGLSENFFDISKMTNLRALNIDVATGRLFNEGVSLPSLETLKIEGSIYIFVNILTEQFPNLKVLVLTTRNLDWIEVQEITVAWQNSMEDLTIQIDQIDQSIASCFLVMQKLRILHLILDDESEVNDN